MIQIDTNPHASNLKCPSFPSTSAWWTSKKPWPPSATQTAWTGYGPTPRLAGSLRHLGLFHVFLLVFFWRDWWTFRDGFFGVYGFLDVDFMNLIWILWFFDVEINFEYHVQRIFDGVLWLCFVMFNGFDQPLARNGGSSSPKLGHVFRAENKLQVIWPWHRSKKQWCFEKTTQIFPVDWQKKLRYKSTQKVCHRQELAGFTETEDVTVWTKRIIYITIHNDT